MTTVASTPNRLSADELAHLARTSYDTILGLQDASGAYPASPNFSAYRGYCWFRDGAFIADGVSSYGGVESADRFFDWCARALSTRREQVQNIVQAAADGLPLPSAEMLPTRFTLAGTEGDDDWWDFQLDGYGTWLWAVAEHAQRHSLSLERWRHAIELSVDYLVSSWSRPCFDWWEESEDKVHASTLGCIAGGLKSIVASGLLDRERTAASTAAIDEILALIASDGLTDGRLSKWLGSAEIDASLIALVAPIGLYEATGSIGAATIATVDAQLTVDGGVHRYLRDTFFGGGQWPLLSCMLGLAFAAAGNRDRALDQLQWAASTVSATGMMPEQVGTHLLDPAITREWVDRWGPVASPLLWSHAMYVRLAVEIGVAVPLVGSATTRPEEGK